MKSELTENMLPPQPWIGKFETNAKNNNDDDDDDEISRPVPDNHDDVGNIKEGGRDLRLLGIHCLANRGLANQTQMQTKMIMMMRQAGLIIMIIMMMSAM